MCITEFPPYIQRTDNAVTVRAAGKEIVFAESAWPALRHLLSGRPAAIDKVTADTGVDAGFLTQVLFDEGICGELTRELATGYIGLLMPEDR